MALRRDDLGETVDVPGEVRRVVSLVPSLTESVAESAPGLLVGATDWCTHPEDLDVTRVGGTKNPDVAAVIALRPDVVLANEEENRPQDVAALRAAGVAVWVTAPRSVPEALSSLERLLRQACGLGAPPRWCAEARAAWAAPHDGPRYRAVVPIWRRPWMVVGRDTFAGDLLARCGVDNAFAGAEARYPKVPLAELQAAAPDLVVLPDEPYAFGPEDGPESFPGVPCALVDGRYVTWYGPTLVAARARVAAAIAAALAAGPA